MKAINDVSFSFEFGRRYLFVGINGSGKTTLMKLICGLYNCDSGRILYNGIDQMQILSDELFSHFSVVFQDYGCYSLTAKENITFSDDINNDLFEQSTSLSDTISFISKYPRNYDTPLTKQISKDGVEPSLGQWQRIALARAFYQNGDVFILDEPCASLDPIAEFNFYNYIANQIKDKLVILVSHNLSSAQIVDKIFFVDNGRILDSGTHEELFNRNKTYQEMYKKQSSLFEGEGGAY